MIATLAAVCRPPREFHPMQHDIETIGPRLLDGIKDLARELGYSRAWGLVRNDTAAAPVYDWLLSAEVLVDVLGEDPRFQHYRAHWHELVSMSHTARRIFTPALDRGHEARPALDIITEALRELGEVAR